MIFEFDPLIVSLSLRMNKHNFNNFAMQCTQCIDNAFHIWSFSADFYFDIKTHEKEKICVIFAFEYRNYFDSIR